jgi:hypothetical protein
MADKVTAAVAVALRGVKVATLGDAGRLFVTIPGHGRTFISKELGIQAGDVLLGNAEVVEETWNNDAEGNKLETPLVRKALSSYTSLDSEANAVAAEAKIAEAQLSLAKTKMKAKAISEVVLTPQMINDLVIA